MFNNLKKFVFLLVVLIAFPMVAHGDLSVITMPANPVKKDTATLWGRVSDLNATEGTIVDMYAKFRYSTNIGNQFKTCETMLSPTEVAADPPPLTGLDFFTDTFYNFKKENLGPLQQNKQYYYCAIVSSTDDFSSGVLYGNVMTFTPEEEPDLVNSVITVGSSNISESGATISGKIIEDNPNTEVWGRFRYSENSGLSCGSLPNAKVTPKKKRAGAGDFSFSSVLTGLKDGTTYHYCAVGSDNPDFFDSTYGDVKQFTTPFSTSTDRIGPVKTLTATQIDDTEVTLRGNYTAGGPGFAYFRLSSTDIPPIFCNQIYGSDMIGVTSNIPDPIGYTLGGDFGVHVNGLEPETDYYYCAVVSNGAYDPTKPRSLNEAQIKYGEVKKFRTLPCDTCNNTNITTKGSDVIDSTSVNLTGDFKSSRAVSVFFEYSKAIVVDPTNPQTPTILWQPTSEKKYGDNSHGSYNQLVKDLAKNTTYNFRAVAKVTNPDISIEIFYGQTLQFTTNKYNGVTGGNDDDGNGIDDPPIIDPGVGVGPGVIITTGDDNCPAGTTGTFPACTPIDDITPLGCSIGWLGTPPNCFNPGPGGTGTDPTTKTPKVTVTANPVFIDAGESSTISWTSSGVSSCVLNGYEVPTSGSADTGGLNNTTSYTVSCSGINGSAADTASVFVNIDNGNGGGDLVWVDVTASPVFFPLNASVTISWTSGGAQFCDSGGHGEGTSGSFVIPLVKASSSHTVTCSGESGTASDTAYIVLYDTGIPPLPTNMCIPTTETRNLNCSAGNTGSVNQTRTSTCPTLYGNPVWSPWTTTTNTCTDPNGNTTPPPPPPPPGACFPSNQTRLLACPAGFTGSINQARTSSCPTANGNPVWTDWVTTSENCKDANGNGLAPTPPGPGNPGVPPNPANPGVPPPPGGPGQNGNPPLTQDNDNDDDGIGNPHDDDTDGDWDPNDTDTDDDGDGIPDFVDGSPNGPGTGDDFDGGGLPNSLDTDMDGDGIPNYLDGDTDGDGVPNDIDLDDDGDGIPDLIDPTPRGTHGDRGSDLLVLGQEATPPSDAIVRYHEGIETVFARQIRRNTVFAERYGYSGGDMVNFAWNLAHTFAKFYFGYINEENLEVRVSAPDVSAYELRQVSNTLVVYEYYKNVIVDIRSKTVEFKNKNPYEYYFRRIFR